MAPNSEEELREKFDAWDEDEDGKLTVPDLRRIFAEELGYFATDDEVNDVLYTITGSRNAEMIDWDTFKAKKALRGMRTFARDRVVEQIDSFRVGRQLPRNTLKLVFQFIPEIETLQNIGWTCRRWRDVSSLDLFWEPLLRRRRRAEQLRAQAYGMLPAITVKNKFKEWYLSHLCKMFTEKDQKQQEERYKAEVDGMTFLHHNTLITVVVPYTRGGKSHILTGDDKGLVQVRDPAITQPGNANAGILHVLSEHESKVNVLFVTEQYIYTGADDCMCHAWSHESLSFPKFTMGAHTDAVTAVGTKPDDETQVVTGSMDRSLIIWTLSKTATAAVQKTGNYTHAKQGPTLSGHSMKITQVACTDKRIFSASTDAQVRVWDWKGKSVAVLTGHGGPVHCMALANLPDRSGVKQDCVVSACGGGMLRCWHPESGKILWTRVVHGTPIHCMDIDGDLVATGASDGSINVYKTSQEMSVAVLKGQKGHESVVRTVKIDATTQRVLSGSDDKTCMVWDIKKELKKAQESNTKSIADPWYTLKGPKAAIVDMVLLRSPTGKWERVIVAVNDKTLHSWKLK